MRSRSWLVVAIAAALALWPAAPAAAAPFAYPIIAGFPAQPTISIDDVTQFEGSPAGITAYTFTVSLSASSTDQIEVTAETADDSATTADNDYSPRTPTILTFDPGVTQQQFIVNANRDTKFETDEAFKVKLTAPTNATIADDEGLGTIKNDDGQPTISIDDVSHDEGNASTTSYAFTVTLSNPSSQQVQVTAQTQDDSATLANSDYQQLLPAVLTFNPGETSKPVTVQVNGDTTPESNEAFNVNLSAPSNATIADGTGVGTIVNDDVASGPQTVSFQAQADARVEDDHETTNYGTSTLLSADDEPEIETFLRFNLTGIAGTIKSAKLRLFATDGTSNGPAAYKTNWTGSETSLNWNNRTPRTSSATDNKGSISTNTTLEYNVTPLVTGNGQHSFILATSSSDGADFASRETTTASRRPELVVTYGTDTQNPTSPTLSASASGSNRVDLSWSGAGDDFGVTGYKVYRNNSLLVQLGPQTTYSDTVPAGGTYAYEVTALDAAGHESSPRSNAVTVKIPIVFNAQADTRVEEEHKSTNYGTSTTLRAVAGSNPDIETFIRFQLSGVTTVSNAKLRLWVTNATSNGPAVYKTNWTGSETSLNWSNRTPRTSGATDHKGSIPADAYVDYNVTALISGNGAHSFILGTPSSDGVDFSSRETSTISRRPQLLITP